MHIQQVIKSLRKKAEPGVGSGSVINCADPEHQNATDPEHWYYFLWQPVAIFECLYFFYVLTKQYTRRK
jgi:hypothetical protein